MLVKNLAVPTFFRQLSNAPNAINAYGSEHQDHGGDFTVLSTIEVMIWVFGLVFLVFVVIWAWCLFRSSESTRNRLINIPRSQRIRNAVILFIGALVAAVFAMIVAPLPDEWVQPPLVKLFGVLVGMIIFVVAESWAAITLISVVTDPKSQNSSVDPSIETDNSAERP